MKVLISPETLNSTASVIEDGPLGLLYVQCLDAYGFQRELTVRQSVSNPEEYVIQVYVHPVRRHTVTVSLRDWSAFYANFSDMVGRYPDSLFNAPNPHRARCAGFVSMQEMIFRGIALEWVL